MNLLRPRYLALAFAAYFGVVCYYAAQEGRRAAFGAYGPGISLTVFQTTMVGAVLVLLGLFVTASISPQIKGAAPSRSPGSLGTSRVIRRLRGDSRMPDDYRTRLQVDSAVGSGGPPGARKGLSRGACAGSNRGKARWGPRSSRGSPTPCSVCFSTSSE